MSPVVRDFFTGSLILCIAVLSALGAFILLLVLSIFFKLFLFFASIAFILFLFFFSIWLVGFLYRKYRERNPS